MAFPVRFVAEGETVQTTSRELDEEGVFVRCVEPPAKGDRVVLRLYLPWRQDADTVEAEVVESGEDGFYARFVEASEGARRHIAQAIAEAPRLGENRRVLPRFLDRFRVTLTAGQHKAQREALNLSASGVFIQTDAPPDMDEIVQVILELPDGKPPAEVQGIVLHREVEREPKGAGVQFIGADDEFRKRLDAYLAQLRER